MKNNRPKQSLLSSFSTVTTEKQDQTLNDEND